MFVRAGAPREKVRAGEKLGLGFLELLVFFSESFDSASGIHQFLFAGEKGMALGTDFHRDVLSGRSGFELSPTVTGYFGLPVFRMNILFHNTFPTSRLI
jgi:hypothetical protein